MALDPENKPKEFLTILVAAGLLIFGNRNWSIVETFGQAEAFVREAESRYGRLNP